MASAANPKTAIRKAVQAKLSALTSAQVVAQSAAVFGHLQTALPAFQTCRSASVYLPMDNSNEVDTWPIVEALLSRGTSVAIPRVTGPKPGDMQMLRLESFDQAKALPRTKWGIPEPDEALAATMEDVTEAQAGVELLLVPGVAFDARCGRVGHGRGYYDSFIAKQRHLRTDGQTASPLAVVGLALSDQILDSVPMVDGHDERLDMVVTPEGPLAYTSDADAAKAASLLAEGAGATAKREREAEEAAEQAAAPLPPLSLRCEIATGRYKYAQIRVTPPEGAPFIAVRSGRGNYHADVAEPAIEAFRAMGCMCEPLGGGRIERSDAPDGGAGTVHIYGYSVGFGGSEGGPPGHGMRDHAETAALVEELLPGHTVTFSALGY